MKLRLILLSSMAAFFLFLLSGESHLAQAALEAAFEVKDETLPAAVTDLSVTGQTATSLKLSWTAPGDDGMWGTATQYEIRYFRSPITSQNEWDASIPVAAVPTPQPSGSTETFTVTGLSPSSTYWFALKAADNVPNWSDLSNSTSGTTLNTGSTSPGAGVSPSVGISPVFLQLELNVFGQLFSTLVTDSGILVETVQGVSPDSMLTLLITQGTILLDSSGNPVRHIDIEPAASPEPPENMLLVTAFNIRPSCTFQPPAKLTLHYDPQSLTDGASEQNLTIGYYDGHQQGWIPLPSWADRETRTITAFLSHTSLYGLLVEVPVAPETAAAKPLPPGSEITPTPETTSHLSTPQVNSFDFNLDAWFSTGIGFLLLGLLVWVSRQPSHNA